jgi:hypothetical protein
MEPDTPTSLLISPPNQTLPAPLARAPVQIILVNHTLMNNVLNDVKINTDAQSYPQEMVLG